MQWQFCRLINSCKKTTQSCFTIHEKKLKQNQAITKNATKSHMDWSITNLWYFVRSISHPCSGASAVVHYAYELRLARSLKQFKTWKQFHYTVIVVNCMLLKSSLLFQMAILVHMPVQENAWWSRKRGWLNRHRKHKRLFPPLISPVLLHFMYKCVK